MKRAHLIIILVCLLAFMFCQVNDTRAVYETGIKLRIQGLVRPNVFLKTSLASYEYLGRNLKQGLRFYNSIHRDDSLFADSSVYGQLQYQLQQWFADRKDIVPLAEQKIDSLFIRNGKWSWESFLRNNPAYRGYVQLSPVYFNIRRDRPFSFVHCMIQNAERVPAGDISFEKMRRVSGKNGIGQNDKIRAKPAGAYRVHQKAVPAL